MVKYHILWPTELMQKNINGSTELMKISTHAQHLGDSVNEGEGGDAISDIHCMGLRQRVP